MCVGGLCIHFVQSSLCPVKLIVPCEMGCNFPITMTSHERHVVSIHRSFDCLFNSLYVPTSKKHQSPHYWPSVRGIHRWPVNSPHKGPATRKMLSFDDVITHYHRIIMASKIDCLNQSWPNIMTLNGTIRPQISSTICSVTSCITHIYIYTYIYIYVI